MFTLPTDQRWEKLYDVFGIRDFINFATAPEIQDRIFAIKLVFIIFTAFFFCALVYFYFNSSYLKYKLLQDVTEFFSWQPYGSRGINKRWKEILKKVDSGLEKDYKFAILEADEFLKEVLEDADYQGETFEELIKNAGTRMIPNIDDVLQAHKIRDLIVHNVNYMLDLTLAKKMLQDYEKAIKNTYVY